MCQKLGCQPNWDFQKVDLDKTRLGFIPFHIRALSVASKNDLEDQNLLFTIVLSLAKKTRTRMTEQQIQKLKIRVV
jgi:hypothetical protein